MLSKLPSDIKLSEIINALEGSIEPVECVTQPEGCQRSKNCVTRDVWMEIHNAIQGILESITLQELANRHLKKQPGEIDYHI